MAKILSNVELAPKIYQMVVEAPRIARKALPGQFVLVMAEERGERVPFTIADFDRQAGTITLVVRVIGTSTMKLSRLTPGESLYALIGPLGRPSEIRSVGRVVMVAGGVGAAPIYPVARAFYQVGDHVTTIQGARSRELLFWTDRLASVSHDHIITTDDGSFGRPGLVTEPLRELLERSEPGQIGRVYAIGPAVMMKACAQTTRPFGVKTIVSLNPIMVDGTGMCGGCRVSVEGKTFFACVDGPDFDGHLVDWDLLIFRQQLYHDLETCSLERYIRQTSLCREDGSVP
jgi:ferredoxin--NADP+ reductase